MDPVAISAANRRARGQHRRRRLDPDRSDAGAERGEQRGEGLTPAAPEVDHVGARHHVAPPDVEHQRPQDRELGDGASQHVVEHAGDVGVELPPLARGMVERVIERVGPVARRHKVDTVTARLTIVNPIAIPQGETAVAVAFPLAARPTSARRPAGGPVLERQEPGRRRAARTHDALAKLYEGCTFTHYLGDKGGLTRYASEPLKQQIVAECDVFGGHDRRLWVVHVVVDARDGGVRGARLADGVVGRGRVRGGRAVLGRGVRLSRPAVRGRAVAVHQRRPRAHRADGRRRAAPGDRGADHHAHRGAGPAGVRSPHAVRRRRAHLRRRRPARLLRRDAGTLHRSTAGATACRSCRRRARRSTR